MVANMEVDIKSDKMSLASKICTAGHSPLQHLLESEAIKIYKVNWRKFFGSFVELTLRWSHLSHASCAFCVVVMLPDSRGCFWLSPAWGVGSYKKELIRRAEMHQQQERWLFVLTVLLMDNLMVKQRLKLDGYFAATLTDQIEWSVHQEYHASLPYAPQDLTALAETLVQLGDNKIHCSEMDGDPKLQKKVGSHGKDIPKLHYVFQLLILLYHFLIFFVLVTFSQNWFDLQHRQGPRWAVRGECDVLGVGV